VQELNSWLSEAAGRAQGSADEEMNTDIVLSLGNKVRRNLLYLS
jgi:hypothetical protein